MNVETVMAASGGPGPTTAQTAPPAARCGNCRYALDRDPATVFCRRYPPVPVYVPAIKGTGAKGVGGRPEDIQAAFPVLQALAGWCGEHDWRSAPA